MIARLKGILLEINLTQLVVDVHGVGYLVFIPMSTYDRLPRTGSEVTLLINTQVREDSFSLYGFATPEEKQLFEILLGATGVGPKLALSILSSLPVSSFCSAIANRDLNVIKRISGIGPKTAERLIVELRDKVGKLAPALSSAEKTVPDEVAAAAEDALLALEQLGFKPEKIRKAIHKIVEELPAKECSSENLIRKALQSLNS
ncbi:MAG: Holliday junction branch migration protein RuvA [Victivallaceae bacterium]